MKTKKKKTGGKELIGYCRAEGGRALVYRENGRTRTKWIKDGTETDEFKGVRQIPDDDPILDSYAVKAVLEGRNRRPYRDYRRKENRPNPKLDAQAEENRLTVKIGCRISPEHRDLFNLCTHHFDTKGEALERAILLLAESLGEESPPKRKGPIILAERRYGQR